jgi:hypothetical protein
VRSNAVKAIGEAPDGWVVTLKPPTRSNEQNARLWAFLSDIAAQMEWYGQKLSKEDWKDMFTASLRKSRVVPGIDPGSFVVMGLHTSTMSKAEFSDLMELMTAFGTERGVIFSDQTGLGRELGK